MAQQLEPVTFDEFLSNAASIFAQIEHEGKGVLVEHDGALFTVKMKRPKTKKSGRAITSQDSILHIIGIAASQGPTDTSTNKHRYLAETHHPSAAMPSHEFSASLDKEITTTRSTVLDSHHP